MLRASTSNSEEPALPTDRSTSKITRRPRVWDGGLVVLALKGAEYVFRKVAESLMQATPAIRKRWVWRSLNREQRALVARNVRFRDLHLGRHAFVIANGPSLGSQDISLLRNEITFVVNAFFKHEIVKEWQPTYYCLADPDLFDGSKQTGVFFDALEHRCPSSTMFVPLAASDRIERYGSLAGMDVNFVAFGGYLQHGMRGLPDLTKVVPGVMGVTQMAIMTAMFMGCSPIYLLGFDHDYLFRRAALIEGDEDRTPHFYEGEAVAGRPNVWATLSTERLLGDELTLYEGYRVIQRVAESNGIEIINATRGGFLDVFERRDYEEIVRGF